jgi:hypothetical protein
VSLAVKIICGPHIHKAQSTNISNDTPQDCEMCSDVSADCASFQPPHDPLTGKEYKKDEADWSTLDRDFNPGAHIWVMHRDTVQLQRLDAHPLVNVTKLS